VWSYTPRSLTDIQNLTAAIQNNDPSLLSTLSDILYVPAPYFAGQVSATQVAAFLDNLALNYGLAGPAAAAISASPYGLWSTNFVTQIVPYLSAVALNLLLSSGQMDANHAQLILYWLAQNYYYNEWIYTVTANAPPSITFSSNVTLSTNVLIAQNITIASGVTVTCGTHTCFFIAQSFNNYGTVVSPLGTPGGAPLDSAGAGGTGGGGIVVIAITAALGTLNVSGNPGGNAVSYTGASGTGAAGGAGIFYVVTGVTVPVGGTGGAGINASYIGLPGYNGGGGGAAGDYYDGGSGGGATVYSFSSPNAMVTYILQGLSDWWLINVTGKVPILTTPLAFMYGSGGGAGAVASGYAGAGGGGGGGGEVVVYGYNIVSGNITAVGGTGGAGLPGCSGCYYGGGGGGGGGLVFIFYGATSGSVTVSLAGGTGGAGLVTASNGHAGSTGVLYVTTVTVNG
jgi:hypothetical protein